MAAVPYRRTFARLLTFLRPYRWSLAVSVVLAVGSQAAAVAIAWLTGDALEHVLTATVVTPFIVVLAYRYSHVAHPVLRDIQQRLPDVATVAEENIVRVHVVKSFAQEHNESVKFEERSERVFDQSVRA